MNSEYGTSNVCRIALVHAAIVTSYWSNFPVEMICLRLHDKKKFLGNQIGCFMPQHWSLRDEIKIESQTDERHDSTYGSVASYMLSKDEVSFASIMSLLLLKTSIVSLF